MLKLFNINDDHTDIDTDVTEQYVLSCIGNLRFSNYHSVSEKFLVK